MCALCGFEAAPLCVTAGPGEAKPTLETGNDHKSQFFSHPQGPPCRGQLCSALRASVSPPDHAAASLLEHDDGDQSGFVSSTGEKTGKIWALTRSNRTPVISADSACPPSPPSTLVAISSPCPMHHGTTSRSPCPWLSPPPFTLEDVQSLHDDFNKKAPTPSALRPPHSALLGGRSAPGAARSHPRHTTGSRAGI